MMFHYPLWKPYFAEERLFETRGYFVETKIFHAMTQSFNGKRIILQIPIERILSETDDPLINANDEVYNKKLTTTCILQLTLRIYQSA
jgi:Tat protein secretion system quality control protein TatD with DNase activity